jgi:hypothetical protein
MHLNQRDLDYRYSSSKMAANLGETLNGGSTNGRAPDPPYLRGVPAYISKSCFAPDRAEQDLEVVRKFIEHAPGYRRIFLESSPGEPAEVANVDTILTGLGIIARKRNGEVCQERTGAFIIERAEQEAEVELPKLAEWIHGDIGGIILPREHLGGEALERVQAMNYGWVGMKQDLLAECAHRGRENDRPGVVVIAEAREKAGIIAASLKLGLISSLIISSALAVELHQVLREKTP